MTELQARIDRELRNLGIYADVGELKSIIKELQFATTDNGWAEMQDAYHLAYLDNKTLRATLERERLSNAEYLGSIRKECTLLKIDNGVLKAELSAKDAIIAELQKESLRGDRQILLEIVECMEMNGHGFVDAMTAFENVRKVIKKYNIKTHYTQPPKGI